MDVDFQYLAGLAGRFSGHHTALIAGDHDQSGLHNRAVDGAIQRPTLDRRLAGPAFPCKGAAATELEPDDRDMRVPFPEDIPTGSVVVPSEVAGDVLAATEDEIRAELPDGGKFSEVYERYRVG